jgi:hypothetical protein
MQVNSTAAAYNNTQSWLPFQLNPATGGTCFNTIGENDVHWYTYPPEVYNEGICDEAASNPMTYYFCQYGKRAISTACIALAQPTHWRSTIV